MPHPITGTDARLPSSHYFLTIARGASMRTVKVRTGAAWCLAALLSGLACWLVGSSLYLVFHDDLVAALMNRQARAQRAYEDRIAALRQQLDRESSRQAVSQSTLEGQVRGLAIRARALETRASLVAQAAGRAGPEGSGDHAPGVRSANAEATLVEPSAFPKRSVTPAWSEEKPHPEANADPDSPAQPHAEADAPSLNVKLAGLTESLERTDAAQYRAMAAIDDAARRRADAMAAILEDVGLSPDRFRSDAPHAAMGGPFVPLSDDIIGSPFGRAFTVLQADVSASEHLSSIMPRLPIASPLIGTTEVTSPFGPRVDPFLGKAAMHTGVDLREDYGTSVRATAAGRVVSAGPAGGYGNMIEIDHGNGLSTRYAHLEAVLVTAGQAVALGDVIGHVGATGRATGPHLHYETRIDGEPVDPMRFLHAGQRLAAAEPAP